MAKQKRRINIDHGASAYLQRISSKAIKCDKLLTKLRSAAFEIIHDKHPLRVIHAMNYIHAKEVNPNDAMLPSMLSILSLPTNKLPSPDCLIFDRIENITVRLAFERLHIEETKQGLHPKLLEHLQRQNKPVVKKQPKVKVLSNYEPIIGDISDRPKPTVIIKKRRIINVPSEL